MERIVNTISLIGWSLLMFSVALQLVLAKQTFLAGDLYVELLTIKFIQTFQYFDIVLILLGKSKGSLLGGFAQITFRNIVAWLFMTPQSNHLYFAMVAVIWSMSQVNRYLYYLFNNKITTLLRYNSFLVLYPIGVYGQMLVINDYIKINAQTLSDLQINIIRGIQACICVGFIPIYIYMLKSRSKHMNKVEQKPTEETIVRDRSRSPKGKRE